MKANEITTYRWDDPKSIIRRIDVRQQSNGWAVAYLYANPDPALKDERLNIRAAIRLKGWGTLSDHRDNAFGLRVTGLREGGDLISMLEREGMVTAPTSQETHREEASNAPTTLWDKIRANSLKYSGYIATLGNAMSFASGIHRGNEWGQIGQGLCIRACRFTAGHSRRARRCTPVE